MSVPTRHLYKFLQQILLVFSFLWHANSHQHTPFVWFELNNFLSLYKLILQLISSKFKNYLLYCAVALTCTKKYKFPHDYSMKEGNEVMCECAFVVAVKLIQIHTGGVKLIRMYCANNTEKIFQLEMLWIFSLYLHNIWNLWAYSWWSNNRRRKTHWCMSIFT